MTSIEVSGKTYKIKFGYNAFCDTDLFDRVKDIIMLLQGSGASSDDDVAGLGKIKDLFTTTRDLLYVGFQKYNPVESPQAVGDLLDNYREEAREGERRGILQIFTLLSTELMDEGFLSDLLTEMNNSKKVTPMKKK